MMPNANGSNDRSLMDMEGKEHHSLFVITYQRSLSRMLIFPWNLRKWSQDLLQRRMLPLPSHAMLTQPCPPALLHSLQ